jgi:hypothetical protein
MPGRHVKSDLHEIFVMKNWNYGLCFGSVFILFSIQTSFVFVHFADITLHDPSVMNHRQ